MSKDDSTIWGGLKKRGVTRRDFLRFCTLTAATLALPSGLVPKIVEALEKKTKTLCCMA